MNEDADKTDAAQGASQQPKRVTRRRFLTKTNIAIGVLVAAGASKVGFDWFVDDAEPAPALPNWLKSRPIAHRGLHDHAAGVPENSMAAFGQAAQAGYPIELDVHVLADGALAVFHDFTLDRMTGVSGPLSRCKVADLDSLRLLGIGQRVPRLEEVLELAAGKTPLLIEAKTHSRKDRTLEQALDRCLAGYQGPFAVQSFNPFSMAWFAEHRPKIIRGQLACDFRDEDLPGHQKWILRNLLLTRWSRPHFINYDIRCLPHWAVSNKRRLGLLILGWVPRSHDEARQAMQHCDNVVFEGYRPGL